MNNNVAMIGVGPPPRIDAVLSSEDRDFFNHGGVDPLGIARALWHDVRSESTQGGSTITQQLAKNLFLTQERTMQRKLQEAELAIWLERKHSKAEILELYLNRVYFGSGAYGVEAAAQRFAKGAVKKRLPLGSWSEVIDYCRTSMAFEGRESFRILFLDKKNGLIADEVQGLGTVDHTPVYPREVMRRALELSATAIVLVHNHPSGDPTPSTQDIKMTLDIIAIAKSLGVAVHDHIIVGRHGHASLKGMRLF